MLDDVELRELRIFLAVLVAAIRQTGAQRRWAQTSRWAVSLLSLLLSLAFRSSLGYEYTGPHLRGVATSM